MAEPVHPKNARQYLDILRNTTPGEYHRPLFANDEAIALYRAMARVQGSLARRGYEVAQAQYFRTHSTVVPGVEPATSWREATGDVLVRRTFDLGTPLYVDAGAMLLRALGGRTYWNAESIYWRPNDPNITKSVRFASTVPGIVGNLDFLGDDNGLITVERDSADLGDANNEVDLAVIDHADLSESRTGSEASVLAPDSHETGSTIRDSGKPDQFSASHKGIYLRIDDAANPENIGRILRILDVHAPGVEHPSGSGLYPHTVEVDDLPVLVPLLAAKQDDGGVFTDYTAEADEDTADDVVLLPAAVAPGDAFYFGASDPFLGVAIAITTPSDGEYQVTWEVWDGLAWIPYADIQDETQGFHLPGELRVEAPKLPWLWGQTTVDGVLAYWLRCRVTAVTLAGSAPLAAKVRALKPDRLTLETGTIQWSALDWKDLGVALVQVEAFSGGRDNTLGLLGEERGVERQKDESDDAYRERIANLADVVSPAAIRRIVSRALEPYGLSGVAHDVQNGMTGLFCDVDACDYYSPGDVFPTDPHKLLYTDALAYGGFEVILPYITDGEYGMACDDGPIMYLEPLQTFLGPACDCCFLDSGEPIKALQVYAALYAAILEARAYPTTFIMWRDETMNTPAC